MSLGQARLGWQGPLLRAPRSQPHTVLFLSQLLLTMISLQAFTQRASLGAFPLAILAGTTLTGCGGSDSDPIPTVTSPAAGAVVGGANTISWEGFGSEGTVDIEVSTDGGTTFAILADDTENDGSFSWDTTAESDGDQFVVRVSGAEGSDGSGVFSVDNTVPVIALTAPDGGELLGAGGVVTWVTTDANPGTVQILASSDSGANFDITVAEAAEDTGTFEWDASTLPEAETYRVQVIANDRAGNASDADASFADFEIDATPPTISLLTPNGGDTLTATEAITWTTVDANPGIVEISLSTDGGASFDETITLDAPDNGSFDWASGRAEDSTENRIRVVAVDAAGNRSTPSISDGDFTTRNVRLQSPAHYRDINGDGIINQGDQIYLRFGERIVVNSSATASDIILTRAGDNFGGGATVTAGEENFAALITLGNSPTLRTRGTFVEGDADTAEFSSIDMVAVVTPNSIEAFDDATDVSSVGPVDVTVQAVPFAATAAETVEARRGAVGDLDGDGVLDLVLAVIGGNPSQRWTGSPDASFAMTQTFDTDDTRDVAIGDVDSDGDLDVVTAVHGPNRVWTNDGTGVLMDSGQTLGTSASQSVDLFDADGDGDLDALFSNIMGQANRIWFNDGLGAFAPSTQALGGGINTEAAAPGDFDGDGDLDFFAANDGSDSQLWRNDGNGLFSGTDVAGTSTAGRDVEVADLDGDGDIDVFMAVLGQKQVLLNDGTGQFPDGPAFYGNNDNRAIELFDVDGDGDIDAVAAKNLDSGRIFLNDGNGIFIEDGVDLLPGAANDLVVGRFDLDSDIDMLVINGFNTNTNMSGMHQPYGGSVSGGQPNADYTAAPRTEGPWQSGDGATGDVNRDGALDIIIPDVVGTVQILLGDGMGDFTEGTAFGGADGREGVLFDADNDGDLDYLLRSGDVGMVTDSLYMNNGSGTFTDSGLTLGVETYAPGDMDGDGDADLVVFDGSMVEVWDGDGTGAFAPSGSILDLTTDHVVGAFFDYDKDGHIDVFSADAMGIRVLENDGDGAFSVATTIAFASAGALSIGDLDRDGDMDLVMGSSGGTTDLSWAENQGVGAFAAAQSSINFSNVINDIELADRDEDGNLDLFAVDAATGNIFIKLGRGDGTFDAGGPLSVPGLSSVTLIDLDRDGDVDVYESLGNGATPSAMADEVRVLD